MKILIIIIQLFGGIALYFWFVSGSKFFFLLNKYKNSNPLLLFFLPLGFISFPFVCGLAFNQAWNYFTEKNIFEAIIFSTIPLLLFLVGFIIFKILMRLKNSK